METNTNPTVVAEVFDPKTDGLRRIGVVGEVWATLYADGWTVYALPATRFGHVESGLSETAARALIEIVKSEELGLQ